jgi:hypothetical protein
MRVEEERGQELTNLSSTESQRVPGMPPRELEGGGNKQCPGSPWWNSKKVRNAPMSITI